MHGATLQNCRPQQCRFCNMSMSRKFQSQRGCLLLSLLLKRGLIEYCRPGFKLLVVLGCWNKSRATPGRPTINHTYIVEHSGCLKDRHRGANARQRSNDFVETTRAELSQDMRSPMNSHAATATPPRSHRSPCETEHRILSINRVVEGRTCLLIAKHKGLSMAYGGCR